MLRAVTVGCGAMSRGWIEAVRDTPAIHAHLDVAVFLDLDAGTAGRAAGAVERALAAGCHVLSGKPVAAFTAKARRLVELAARAGRLHGVAQNRRWPSGIQRARAFPASGAIGEVTAVRCDLVVAPRFGGLLDQMEDVLLLDMAIHSFDQARCLTGLDAAGVHARETNPKESWHRHGASADALLDLKGGATMTYRGSRCAAGLRAAWESSWRVVGTLLRDGNEGVRAERAVGGPDGLFRPFGPVRVPPLAEPITEGHAGVIAEFVTAVREGREPLTPGHDSVRSLAMVFGAIERARAGQRTALRGPLGEAA